MREKERDERKGERKIRTESEKEIERERLERHTTPNNFLNIFAA